MPDIGERSTVVASAPLGAVQLTESEIRRVFAGLMIGLLLSALDGTIVATALPTMVGDLGGAHLLSWVFTAYLLTSTVTVPLYGKLCDVHGRKRLFQVAIVIFVIGSVAIAASQTMLQLVLARAFQGLGAGGLVTLAMTIVGDIISPRQRGRYMGYITSVFAVASVAGPLVGGFFVDHLTWRWAFLINVPLSFIALVVTERNLRFEPPRQDRPVDYLGALLLTVGIVVALLVTVAGEEAGWRSPWVPILAVAGVALLVSFGWQQRRTTEAIIPPVLFRDDVFGVAIGINLLMGIALFAAMVFLPVFLQVSLGVSATASGLLIMPMMIALLVSSILGGRLMTRTGRYKPIALTGSILLVGGTGVLATMGTGSPPLLASAAMLLVGTAIGLAMPVLTVAIQNSVDPRHLGTATSMTDFSRKIGGVFGVALLGALLNARVNATFDDRLADGALPGDTDVSTLVDTPAKIAALPEAVRVVVREAMAGGVRLVFLVGIAFAVLAVLLALRLKEKPLQDDLPGTDPTGEISTAADIEAGGPPTPEPPTSYDDEPGSTDSETRPDESEPS
jgi:EmrB/QacA subfamily drug resistance transporter